MLTLILFFWRVKVSFFIVTIICFYQYKDYFLFFIDCCLFLTSNTLPHDIQDISQNEAEVLDDCFCSYINGKPAKDRTEAEMLVVRLKRELEKLY